MGSQPVVQVSIVTMCHLAKCNNVIGWIVAHGINYWFAWPRIDYLLEAAIELLGDCSE